MAEHDVPSIFRAALDEPVPPAPPEIEDGDDGDGGHHILFVHPVVMLLSNGGLQTTGWMGSLLVAWTCLASFVTAWSVVDAVWWWLARRGILENVWDLSAGFVWFMVGFIGARVLWSWWKRRRAVKP